MLGFTVLGRGLRVQGTALAGLSVRRVTRLGWAVVRWALLHRPLRCARAARTETDSPASDRTAYGRVRADACRDPVTVASAQDPRRPAERLTRPQRTVLGWAVLPLPGRLPIVLP